MSDDLNEVPTRLTSADGISLSARIHTATNDVPVGVAAIAHPHPQFGGNMDNNVVMAMLNGLVAVGASTVRFDFRGVGDSDGSHDGGVGERLDYLVALNAAAELEPTAPLYAFGYSFGADVALTCDHPRLAAWIVVAPPLRMFDDALYLAATDRRPKHIIAGEHDQIASPDMVRAATAGWKNVIVHPIEGTDHFFAGMSARITELTGHVIIDER